MSPTFPDSRACAALLVLLSPVAQAAEPASTGRNVAPLIITTSKSAQPAAAVVEAEQASKPLMNAVQVDQHSLQSLSPATSDTASLLRDVPGVSLNSAGGISSLPAIRGLADDRLRIKVDGMDLVASCPNHMNPALSYIAPSALGSLQVFAGITPVSVGGDSIGGTIIADSIAPEFAAPGAASIDKGEVGAFYRSNNDARGGNLSATHAEEIFNIRYDGSYSKANDYSAGGDFKSSTSTGQAGNSSPLDEVASSAYETESHALSMGFKLGEDLLELKLGYQHVPQELFANQRMDMTDNTQERISLRYLSQFDWGELDTLVYHEKVDHSMNFGPDKKYWYGAAANIPGMPMDSQGRTTGASVKASIDLTPQDLLRVGGEYQRYRLNDYWDPSGGMMGPGTFENINDGQRDRAALFSEWESQLSADWLTLLGVRYENVQSDAGDVHGYAATNMMGTNQLAQSTAFNASDRSQTDHNWDLSALARYTHSEQLDVEFGYARKVRSPSLYERYTWSSWSMAAVMNNFVGDGNGYVGDIELSPETAHTLSTTFDWHSSDRRHELKLTPFYTHVDNYIDAVSLPGSSITVDKFNVLQYANQSARLYGMDVSGKMPLASNPLGNWGVNGLINYTNGKNLDTNDDLYNVMPLNGKLALTQQVGGWSNSFEMESVLAKNHGSEVRNEVQTAGYTLFNLRASHSWKQVRLDFGVENLADKFYYLPTGGTYTGQGTTMGINSIPAGIAVPGMGRSLYTGVNVAF
jgi:iron complex outermembrane recepter protein